MDGHPAATGGDGDSAALWDWGNLLDFAIHDDDGGPLILPWSSSPLDDSPQSPQPPSPSVAPPQGAEGPSLVRKRDPRLVCPNYLAGRVPCSCPEVDEEAAASEEAGAEVLAGARKRARIRGAAAVEVRCQVPGCEADIRELKGYHRRHRVCLQCANALSVALDGVHKRYCQQCGKFHMLNDFDEGKRSCRRKLERHNKRRRRKSDSRSMGEKEMEDQMDVQPEVACDGESKEENQSTLPCEVLETVVSNKILDKEMPLGSEDRNGSPICSLPSLQNGKSNSVVSFAISTEACPEGKAESTKPFPSSTICENKSAYSPSCPTGRISFKLYDWNPAEFPRRLRLQIFEWLASMPVELEGYIRPGCTILTVFIAMPQLLWKKLSWDPDQLVRDFVNAPDSLLLGRGSFVVHLNNTIVQILKDGTSLMNIKMEVQVPWIHYVHPRYFEVGKPIEFVVCGSYLDQPKFRFLVSFNGKYLKHKCWHVESHLSRSHDSFDKNVGGHVHCPKHEVFRINIAHSEAEVYGPAFIEVENASGLSNFVPVLFCSRTICSELERMEEQLVEPDLGIGIPKDTVAAGSPDSCELFISKQNAMSELLLDIGWLLKKPCLDGSKNILSPINIQRLNCLLGYLIQNKLVNVLEIMLQSLENVFGSDFFSTAVNDGNSHDLGLFLENVSYARKIICCNTMHDVKPEMDSRYPISGINMQQSYFEGHVDSPVLSTNSDKGTGSEDGSCPTTEGSEDGENTTLLSDGATGRRSCYPRLTVGWSRNSLPGTVMKPWIAAFVMFGTAVCCAACVVLLHPHKPGMFSVTIKRYLFGNSRS